MMVVDANHCVVVSQVNTHFVGSRIFVRAGQSRCPAPRGGGRPMQAASRPRKVRPRRFRGSSRRLREVVELGVEHVPVDAQREAGVGVTEHSLDGLRAGAGRDHPSRRRVAQDVDARRGQTEAAEHGSPDSVVEVRQSYDASARCGEDRCPPDPTSAQMLLERLGRATAGAAPDVPHATSECPTKLAADFITDRRTRAADDARGRPIDAPERPPRRSEPEDSEHPDEQRIRVIQSGDDRVDHFGLEVGHFATRRSRKSCSWATLRLMIPSRTAASSMSGARCDTCESD